MSNKVVGRTSSIAVEVIVLQQLLPRGRDAGVDRLEYLAREETTDTVQQLLGLLRIGDVLHPLGHRPVGDDLRALEELIAPDVVPVFVRVDDAPRHGGPHLAEHLDHLPRMGQVRLRVDHNTPGPVDEAGVGVTHAVLLVQDRKAVVADLLHLHEGSPINLKIVST